MPQQLLNFTKKKINDVKKNSQVQMLENAFPKLNSF